MPVFPIIDAHVHLWDPTRYRIPWLDENGLLHKRYGLVEYQEQIQNVPVEALVYVEVDVAESYALLEPRWVAVWAKEHGQIQAIVAHAPVEYGELLRVYLDELVSISPLVKGVRRLLQSEVDPEFCLQPAFVRGVQMLAEYGLSFDICIKHYQLASIIQLVRQCPDTAFMLDHCAKPNIKEQVFDPWREQMQALAAYPNVMCKVSGLVSEADQQHWSSADLAPYIAHVIETFGEDRVVFGGDWPVVLEASTYARWVETLDALTSQLSPEAQLKLWAENARTFYRLSRA